MSTFQYSHLLELGRQILTAAGVSDEDAVIIAQELADANVVGHDSHGVMRLVQYVEFIRDGYAKPGAESEVVEEGPTFAIVDGHFNFGQVTTRFALDLGIRKAKEQGTATVLIRNCNHIGRLGAYTHEAALNGMVAMMAVNAPGPGGVAPFGGIERRLGTNPISIAAPAGNDAIILDMTTSATAEGKLRVAKQKGEMIPEGLIIDGQGIPSCDPNSYYNKPYGSILPLGGASMGHKGFGLSVMIDVLCGILSNSGVCRTDLPRGANGVWMQFYEIERFLPRADYDRWMDCYMESIKGCPRLPGVNEIYLPGEIEKRTKETRLKEGVAIPPETWRQLLELATQLNVDLSLLISNDG